MDFNIKVNIKKNQPDVTAEIEVQCQDYVMYKFEVWSVGREPQLIHNTGWGDIKQFEYIPEKNMCFRINCGVRTLNSKKYKSTKPWYVSQHLDILPVLSCGRNGMIINNENGTVTKKIFFSKDSLWDKKIFEEYELQKFAHDSGLSTPQVYNPPYKDDDGLWSLDMQLINGVLLREVEKLNIADCEIVLEQVVKQQCKMEIIEHYVDTCKALSGYITDTIKKATFLDAPLKEALLSRFEELDNGNCGFIHPDFNKWNVMYNVDKQICYLIDWSDPMYGSQLYCASKMYFSFAFNSIMGGSASPVADMYLTKLEDMMEISRNDVIAWLPFEAVTRLSRNLIKAKSPRKLDVARTVVLREWAKENSIKYNESLLIPDNYNG